MATLHNGIAWRNRSPEYRSGMLKKALNAGLVSMYDDNVTNHQLSKRQDFIEACKKAGIEPTVRQASKFRRQFGSAYAAR